MLMIELTVDEMEFDDHFCSNGLTSNIIGFCWNVIKTKQRSNFFSWQSAVKTLSTIP